MLTYDWLATYQGRAQKCKAEYVLDIVSELSGYIFSMPVKSLIESMTRSGLTGEVSA
jgi:hypothetical protein